MILLCKTIGIPMEGWTWEHFILFNQRFQNTLTFSKKCEIL